MNQATSASPGTVIDFTANGLDIACQTGVLRVTRVQLPGAKQSTIKDFYINYMHKSQNFQSYIGHPCLFSDALL